MAGLIPRDFIDELLARVDIVELIDGYVPLKKRGTNFVACCPFHNEKNPSFSVTSVKQFYHCFSCGVSGNAISFLMAYRNLTFPAAIEELAARLGLTIPYEKVANSNPSVSTDFYTLLQKVNHYYSLQLRRHPQATSAIDYLKQRGFNGTIAQRYQIGFAPPGWDNLLKAFAQEKVNLCATGMLIEKQPQGYYDRYRNRIMFPIHDRRGRIIGFGGRVINSHEQPKYLNSPETSIFHKSRELYGLYHILKQPSRPNCILVVEGYLDVMALAQHTITNAVATLGTATSKEHIQLLSRYTKHLIFCFDGDNAGRQAAWKALENGLTVLSDNLQLNFMFLPQDHDPDTLVRQEGSQQFQDRIAKAMSLADFFFQHLMQDIDTSQTAGRSKLIDVVLPYLRKLPSTSYRQLLLAQLARLVRLDPIRLEQLLQQETPATVAQHRRYLPPSNLRLAMIVLLQHPTLISAISDIVNPNLFTNKDTHLLKQLLQHITQTTNCNTGILIEQFRDDASYFELVTKLAATPIHIPADGLAAELRGAICQLQQQAKNRTITQLLQKANQHGLNDSERDQLQQLIKIAKLGDDKQS